MRWALPKGRAFFLAPKGVDHFVPPLGVGGTAIPNAKWNNTLKYSKYYPNFALQNTYIKYEIIPIQVQFT